MLDQLLFVWELVYSQQLAITKDRLLFQNVEVKYKIWRLVLMGLFV